ncbi:kinesin-like protein KIF25 isoform X2 [Sus scrofa]|uniref:kinesin-like protein KIF25 isoform X2 n=1 Tax=Sus scrofa TaxID=9823 RepID=UPI000A2B006F|nr:kinesin-like protein KIF25 isoform X2 [Sus scrofa]
MLRVACIVPTCSGNAGFVYLDLPCSHGPPDTWLPVGGLDTRLEFVPRKEGRCRSRSREVNSGPESVLGCMSRPALSRAVEKPLRDGIFLLQLRERSQWRFVQCTPRPAGSGSGRAGASLRPVGAVATLRGDLERLRSSALGLLGTFRAELQHCVAQVVAVAARTAQLHREAVQSAQPAERLERTLQEVAERWQRERRERRRLHDALVELRGNIRVHCRIRPLLPSDNECDDPAAEKSPVSGEVVHAVDDETVLVDCSRSGHPRINKTYTFERYHVCIMAYGQTGSGKSFTMLGPHAQDAPASRDELGILPRAAHELFRLISEDPSRSPGVQVSVVEVYNNGIFDLLASDGCGVTSGVKRRVLTTHEGQEVSGLTHESVHSAEEFMTLVGAGLQLRARQATAVHSDSSRSHLVVTLTLTRAASSHSTADTRSNQPLPQGLQRLDPQQPTLGRSPSVPRRASFVSPSPQALRRASEQVHAKLQLVDLAGSECAGVSGATGLALRETSSINRSLAALADVLGALSEGRGHVPYRNSRLTHLLQDALGGDAKLQVIVCVSPGQKHVAETLQSLGFGARARQVERGRPAPRKRR